MTSSMQYPLTLIISSFPLHRNFLALRIIILLGLIFTFSLKKFTEKKFDTSLRNRKKQKIALKLSLPHLQISPKRMKLEMPKCWHCLGERKKTCRNFPNLFIVYSLTKKERKMIISCGHKSAISRINQKTNISRKHQFFKDFLKNEKKNRKLGEIPLKWTVQKAINLISV